METFHKYKKIHALGSADNSGIFADPNDRIVVQEKIDGGNFRFYFKKDGTIIFGSRTQQLTSNDGKDSNVAKGFRRCIDYVRKQVEKIDVPEFWSNYIFYGENVIKHTMSYDWENTPIFLGFDILDTNDDKFLTTELAKFTFEFMQLDFVPIIKECRVCDLEEINDDIVPISKYACKSSEDQQAEGLVFKNYAKQLYAKYVRGAFKEKNSATFGKNPKFGKLTEMNDDEFVFKYCTNARIEKLIMKHVNLDMPLDMKLMGLVIKETYVDIIEEEWREILLSNWKLDFKHIRKQIALRCRAVLQQMMVNNARCK